MIDQRRRISCVSVIRVARIMLSSIFLCSCEESCPVKAISKDEHGIEHIDESKCIYCGKCMNACPFGAIFEISQTFDVLQRIRKGEKMVAIIVRLSSGSSRLRSNKYMELLKK